MRMYLDILNANIFIALKLISSVSSSAILIKANSLEFA